MRIQPPVRGGRRRHSAGFIKALDRWVEREAAHFDCSESFVIATCVGIVSGIQEQPSYRQDAKTKPRAKVLRMVR